MMVKSEENNGRRRVCIADGEAKCVKRRRRDAGLVAVNFGPNTHQEDQISSPTTVKRSSRFRGVSRHRWTGRFEAHLWDKLSWNVTLKKKGKQGKLIPLVFFLIS